MLIGDFVGTKVRDAKSLVKNLLIEQKLGLTYYEPEGQVISRLGDECVVALVDQFILKYGEADS